MNKPFDLKDALRGCPVLLVDYEGREHPVTKLYTGQPLNSYPLRVDYDYHNSMHAGLDGDVPAVGKLVMAPRKVKKTVYVNVIEEPTGEFKPFIHKTLHSASWSADICFGNKYVAVAAPVEIEVAE
jgi:hypothetical protein